MITLGSDGRSHAIWHSAVQEVRPWENSRVFVHIPFVKFFILILDVYSLTMKEFHGIAE